MKWHRSLSTSLCELGKHKWLSMIYAEFSLNWIFEPEKFNKLNKIEALLWNLLEANLPSSFGYLLLCSKALQNLLV